MDMTPVTEAELQQIEARQALWATEGADGDWPHDDLKDRLISTDLSRVIAQLRHELAARGTSKAVTDPKRPII